MAVDDNTSYELTGAQVKDLAQKIRNKADDNVFVGSSSSVAGSKGLVPAPSAGSQNSFLKGDGTWAVVSGSGPTVVQTTGQSTTDVMSQKAVTDIIGNVETILQTLNSGGGAQ